MKLIQCHIENFGKLEDVTINFSDGLQEIHQENGWGKSTLAAFLRVMLYGFSGESKRNGLANERKRYLPWQGGVYGGQLLLEVQGKTYLISRTFGEKKSADRFELRDASTNQISHDFSENIGEELFHINAESFAKTVFVGQNDCSFELTDSIHAQLGDLSETMDQTIGFQEASDHLQATLNQLNPNRKTGLAYRLLEKENALKRNVAQGAHLPTSIAETKRDLALVQNQLAQLQEEKKTLSAKQQNLNELDKARILVKERELTNDEKEQFDWLQNQRIPEITKQDFSGNPLSPNASNSTDTVSKSSSAWMILLIIGICIIAAGGFACKGHILIGIILLAAGVFLALAGVLLKISALKKKPVSTPAETLRANSDMALYQHLLKKQRNYEKAVANYEALCKQHGSNVSVQILNANADSENTIASQEARLSEEIHRLSSQLDSLGRQEEEWIDFQQQLDETHTKRLEAEQKYAHLAKTKELLTQAKDQLASKYMNPLEQGFRDYFSFVIQDSVNSSHLDSDLHLSLKEKGMQRSIDSFSSGYQDLAGFSMRLAMIDALYTAEQPFLILDDPFVNLDTEKLSRIKALLKDLGTERQIVYFTCNASRSLKTD